MPRDIKPEPALDQLGPEASYRTILGDGSYGGPYQMSDEVMARLFDGVVEEAAALLESLK